VIYVDEIKSYAREQIQPSARRCGNQWSHMWCDGDVEELHAFAKRIGMKREWFQDHRVLPHYDLVPSRRALAIKLGAKVTSLRDYLIELREATREIKAEKEKSQDWVEEDL